MTATVPVTVIDYRMGNLRSIGNALAHVGASVRFARHVSEAAGAGHLVLPGVGAFGASMENLRRLGFVDLIRRHVEAGHPLLGICLGFQVLFARGTEMGAHEGLGLLAGSVDRFETRLPVPHVGWNELSFARPHPIREGLGDAPHVYFVHSFRPVRVDAEAVLATTDYDGAFPSMVARGSLVGAQFHPEKSGADGLRMLANFLAWSP